MFVLPALTLTLAKKCLEGSFSFIGIIFACITYSCLCCFNFYFVMSFNDIKSLFLASALECCNMKKWKDLYDSSSNFLFSCVYVALYSIILFCVFLWIPFVYFYYEEKDDDNVNKCSVRRRVSCELPKMTGS